MPKLTPRHYGDAKNGKFYAKDSDRLMRDLLANEGPLYVTLHRDRPGKSNNQNRYYRGVIVPWVAEKIGCSEQKAHAIIGQLFFIWYDDDGYAYVRSSENAEWSTTEWEDKMRNIREWAYDEWECLIPLPNEVLL
jgi:hypothetical protein